MIKLKTAQTTQDFDIAKRLFKDYVKELGIDLSFQDFEKEVENIKDQYYAPSGTLLLVFNDEGEPIGCVGVRKQKEDACELKRMYIAPSFRKRGIGDQLMEASFNAAKKLNYAKMRLDTLSSMHPAMNLYKKHGFYEIDAYYFNPIKSAVYFEKKL